MTCSRSPGPSDMCQHELYGLLLRGIIEAQLTLIADLQRRLTGQPITKIWLDNILQGGGYADR